MKLYVNDKEVEPLKQALRNAKPHDSETRDRQLALLERVVLCEQLQGNVKRAESK